MSILSKFVRDISGPVAAVASVIPTPTAQGIAIVSGNIARQTEKRKIKRAQEAERQNMINYDFGGPSTSTLSRNLAATTPRLAQADAGGGFLSTLRSGIQTVGGIVGDVFNTGIPQLFGAARPQNVGQQPALTTVTNIGAQESQGSGSIQAGAGSLLAPVLSGARNLLKTPQGQLALGGGSALVGSMFGGDAKQMRVTRKMKSQARMVLNMTGGNLAAAADILGIDQNTLVMILLKRLRNDGPVVTKAALRKTKQTIRRLHNMQDVLKSITPTATRRRTPMKRASTTTLIKN